MIGYGSSAQSTAGGRQRQALMQTGDLYASMAYRVSMANSHLSSIERPACSRRAHGHAPHSRLQTFYPEPLVFYASVLKDAVSPKDVEDFVKWLQGDEAQILFREGGFQSTR